MYSFYIYRQIISKMKSKVKDSKLKNVVEAYQQQVQKAIDEINSRDGKLSTPTKNYLEVLETNLIRAPFLLGYLEWPEEKKSKK